MNLGKKEGTNAEFLNFDAIENYKDFGGVRIEDDILITADEARDILREAPGCQVIDKHENGGYITPYESAGEDATYISRIREDATVENGLNMWVVSDNLRKGAALNAIQIAELLVARGLIKAKKQAA